MSRKKPDIVRKQGFRPSGLSGTLADIAEKLPDAAKQSLHIGTSAKNFRNFRLFTGIVDLDLFVGVVFGSRVQFVSKPSYGKSVLCHILTGAFQRTCRLCYTPIIEWVDDWSVLKPLDENQVPPNSGEDEKAHRRRLDGLNADRRAEWEQRFARWTDGDRSAFKTVRRCSCGANDPMRVLFINTEDSYDPYWAKIWGADPGDFAQYGEVGYEEVAGEDGKMKSWTGLLMSPDNKFMICQPSSAEVVLSVLQPLISDNVIDAVIIDSITQMTTAEDLAGKSQPASQARFISRFWKILLASQLEAKNKTSGRITVVMTNQMRTSIGVTYGDPNQEAGGNAQKFTVDTTVQLVSSKINEFDADHKLQRRVTRDIEFKLDKRRGTITGRGHIRLFLDDFSPREGVTYTAGETNEADMLWAYLKQLGDPTVAAVEEDGKKKTKKRYWICGRPFDRVRDAIAFLRRPDIQYQLRFVIFAKQLAVTERMHLRHLDFSYNPFNDRLTEIINDLAPTTGDTVRQIRGVPVGRSPAAAPAAAVGDPGSESRAGGD